MLLTSFTFNLAQPHYWYEIVTICLLTAFGLYVIVWLFNKWVKFHHHKHNRHNYHP